LAGSLKYFQLQKDLLKKAEEAAKRKKDAETEVNTVQEILRLAKEKEISLTDLAPLLDEIMKRFQEADYEKCMELAREFKQKSSPILKDEVERAATTVLGNVNTAKVSGIPVGDNVLRLMSLLEKGEYAEAFSIVYKCREETSKLLREAAIRLISQTEKMLPIVPRLGGDPEKFKEVIEESRRYLEEGLVSDALTRVSAIVSLITTLAKNEVVKARKEIERVLPFAKESGVDLTKYLTEIQKAEERLSASQDVSSAMDSVSEICESAQKEVKDIVKKAVGEVERAYNLAKDIDADLTKVDRIISQMKENDARGERLKAIWLAMDALKAIDGLCLAVVMDRMNHLKPKLVLGRKLRPDLSGPLGLLKEARDATAAKDYKKALEKITECDKEISGIVGEFESLRSEITSIEESINRASKLGADTSAISTRIEITRSLLDEKEFSKVRTLLIGIKRDIDKLLSNTVVNIIEEGEKLILLGDKLEVETTEFAKSIDKATSAMNSGDYEEAVKIASEATDSIKKAMNKKVEEIMMRVEGGLSGLTDEKRTEVNDLYAKVENAIKSGKNEEAWSLAVDLVKKMEEVSSGEINRVLREARDYLDVLTGIKGKDPLLEKKYELAIENLEKKDTQTALKIATDLISEVKKHEKELAERLFTLAKEILVDVRKRGANIEDVRPLLQESRNALDKQDYKTAIAAAMKCRSSAMRKLEVLQNAYDAISTAATLVAEAKMKGLNVRSVARTLIKAKDNFKERNYEEARKLAEASRKEVEEMLLGVKAQEEMLRVKNLLSVGSEGGIDMSNLHPLLKEVENALAKNDPAQALSIIKTIDEGVNALFLAKADQLLGEMSALITEVEKSGISIAGIRDMSMHASQAIIENNAFEAYHYAEVAYKEVVRIKETSQKATEIIKQSYERINEVEGYHGDASASKAYLNQAVKFFKLGDFEKAIEFGQKSLEEAEIAEMRLLTRVISDVHAMVNSAKKDGVNTALAENLLTRAKQALDEKKYKEALNLAMKSENELEKVGLQQEMASTTIMVTETKIQKMKEEGFTSPEVEEQLKKAKEYFDAGDYIQALDIAIQASNTLMRASEAFTQIKENYTLMRSAIELLDKCRIDLGDLRAESEEVTRRFKEGAYIEVKDKVSEILKKAKGIAADYSKEICTYCSWFIDFSGTLGVDTSEVKRFFEEGLTYFERKIVDKGMESMMSVFLFLEPGVKDALGLAITELTTKLNDLKTRGKTDTEAESLISKAKESVDHGWYKEAHEVILSCISRLESLAASLPQEVAPPVTPVAQAEAASVEPAESAAPALISPPEPEKDAAVESKIDELKKLKERILAGIEGCKKFGFPHKQILEMLAEVEKKEKEGSIDDALSRAKNCSAELEKILEKVTPVVEGDVTPIPEKVELGAPVELTIKFRNISKAVAKDVTVEIEGSAEITGDKPVIKMLKAGGEESHKLSIRFTSPGDLEIKLKISYYRIFDNTLFSRPVSIKAHVIEPKVLEFVPADKEYKCSICKGKIKPGFMMFGCECGYIFHEPCAIRAGRCPNCNRDLPKKKGKSKLALTFG